MNDRVPADTLLDVRDLRTEFTTGGGVVRAVDGVSWDVRAGETVALGGEAGGGNAVGACASMGAVRPPPIMGLGPRPAGRIPGGQILFRGRDLLELPEEQMRRIRGREIAMV